MKSITMFQTFDGKVHGSQKLALSHLDKLYGELLCSIAHRLCQIDKYKATTEYLDENLHQFLDLDRIKKDMELINDDSED